MKQLLSRVAGFIWKRKVWLIIALVIAGGLWWKFKPKAETAVTAVTPTVQSIKDTLSVSGSVDAKDKATIPYGTGLISWVGAKEDQPVKKWQALAKMDTRTLEKQLQQDLNNFNKQFRNHDQLLDDNNYYNNPSINLELKRILENANYDLNNSVVTVEIRDLAIRMATITSPIDGIVTKIDKPYGGVYASVADTIEVVNPKTIYFSAIVDETDVGKVSQGQPVAVDFDAFPDKTYTSTIDQIEFTPSTSRSGGIGYRIHIPIKDTDLITKLRLGMNGTATIVLAEKANVLTIPVDALISRDGKNYVDVQNESKVERREVTTGIETDTTAEVTQGLTTSDRVVLPTKGK